ncbi:hypothetical protein AC579_7508 [Pseudocercospora musae]|uniref:Uncharacterized protein n=1 Tax=Pseudocercospora musae TaxID=113226 RepID=A0A139IBN9_9PEZI|nr:hypothetical protein AC579_7508 [Pseudocercospora musae]
MASNESTWKSSDLPVVLPHRAHASWLSRNGRPRPVSNGVKYADTSSAGEPLSVMTPNMMARRSSRDLN